MNIIYKEKEGLNEKNLEFLFLSVGFNSGKYPERLLKSIMGNDTVITAWDNEELVGLTSAIDDGAINAYFCYLLVQPKYQKNGIGKELVIKLKNKYKSYSRIIFVSEEKNVPFYEKLGFFKDGFGMFRIDWNNSNKKD